MLARTVTEHLDIQKVESTMSSRLTQKSQPIRFIPPKMLAFSDKTE